MPDPSFSGTVSEDAQAPCTSISRKAVAMEAIVSAILALSGNPSELQQQLKNASQQLASSVELIPQAIQALDPAANSLGMLVLLDAWAKTVNNPQGDINFVDQAASFLMQCQGSQIKLASDALCRVCRKLKEQAMAMRCPRRGILPILSAIRALQTSSEMLTPMHGDFLQLCLLAKTYNAAEQLLEEDILDVDPSRTSCTPTDLYLYSLYGSMICIGRKQWTRALELLLLALGAPSNVQNAIVLACYKKFVLTTLIHSGQMPSLPKYVSQRVRQMTEAEARPYNELASAYGTHNASKVTKVIDNHTQTFTADGNLGLVKLVAASLTTRNIQRLTTTYLTLSLADIASRVGLPSPEAAEMHILAMVERGEIFATISEAEGGQGAGMVRFLEDREHYASAATVERLNSTIRRCIELSGRVTAAHDAVAADKEYLKKVGSKDRSRYLDTAAEEFAALGGQTGMF